MKSTYLSSRPTYLARSNLTKRVSSTSEVNYAAGVMAHELERIRRAIDESFTEKAPFTAPVFQLTPAARQQLNQFVTLLEPFATLQKDWNGAGTVGPTLQGVMVAIAGCARLAQAGFSAPQPKMLSDGSLGAYWRTGVKYAALDFEDDGEHLWTVTDGKSTTSGIWKRSEAAPQGMLSLAQDIES